MGTRERQRTIMGIGIVDLPEELRSTLVDMPPVVPDDDEDASEYRAWLGRTIDGKYRLQSVLGLGGLGTVVRAQHVGSLVTVALKLLHPRFAERPEYRQALLPEARRAATVVHERCARLLDVGEILAVAVSVLRDRIAPLFDHFSQDGQHVLVAEFLAFVDLDLLDGRGNQAQNFEPVFFAGLHCGFDVVRDFALERHGGPGRD